MIKSPITHAALTVALLLWAGICNAPSARAQTAVFQNGTTNTFTGQTYDGAQDTMIAVNNPTTGFVSNWNFGGATGFELGSFPYEGVYGTRHDLIRFDLTSMAGKYTAITGVTLRLTFASGESVTSSNTVEVHQVSTANTGWVAGTGDTSVGTGGQSTWAFRNQTASGSGTSWAGSAGASMAGTDYLAATVASANWTGMPGSGTKLDLVFTDTSFITDWINGTNSGLFLKNSDESAAVGNSRIWLYASQYSGIAARPELIVNYTAVPEPSTYAALAGLVALGYATYRRRTKSG